MKAIQQINGWSAIINGSSGFMVSKHYESNDIVNRAGGPDSFAAGFIYGMQEFKNEAQAIEFAVVASTLKDTIPGDN